MPTRRPRNRRSTRKKPSYYLLPIGISVGIIVMVTLLFNVYTHMQAQQEQALKSESIAKINIENDNTSVIFNNERTKVFKGYSIDWNNGEGLETGADARLNVPLATKDTMRLDSNSTVFAKRDEGRSIVLAFNKGNMWVSTKEKRPASDATAVRMNTMRFSLTDAATVALSDNETEEVVAVLEGQVPVTITDAQGAPVRTLTVGVGQQLRLSPQTAMDTTSNPVEAIPTTTSESDWFRWNRAQDAANPSSGNLPAMDNSNANANTNAVNASGLEKPTLTNPRGTTVSAAHVELRGTVGSKTDKVRINDYVLQKYTSGSTEWTYFLNAGDNMQVGANTYSIVALDKDGNESDPLMVTLSYDPTAQVPEEPTTASNMNTNAAKPSNANTNKTTTNANTNAAAVKKPVNQNTNTAAPTAKVTPKPATPAPASNNNVLVPANVRSGTGSGL